MITLRVGSYSKWGADCKFQSLLPLNLRMNVTLKMAIRKPARLNLYKLTSLSFTACSYWVLFPLPFPFQMKYSRLWALWALKSGQDTVHCMADYFTHSKKLSPFETRLKSHFHPVSYCSLVPLLYWNNKVLNSQIGPQFQHLFSFFALFFVSSTAPHTKN